MEKNDFVDAHFHIWDLKKFEYSWPSSDSKVLFRNFYPSETWEGMKQTPVRHGVFIQVLNNTEEAKWVMEEAQKHEFIKGVVAGVSPASPQLENTLDDLQTNMLFKGIRHILDMEEPTYLTYSSVHRGLGILERRGLTFDLLLRPPLLKYVPDLARKFPRLRMVVDHIAKPYIRDQILEPWKEEIAEIAKFPNIYCKLSGLVVEADLEAWKIDHFQPYVKHVLECFGVERCMFGSDWPVCLLASASYKDVYQLLDTLLGKNNRAEKQKIFKENAVKFYGLKL